MKNCYGVMALVLLLLLSGCTDYSELKRTITAKNMQVEEAITSYEQTLDPAHHLETILIDSLTAGDYIALMENEELNVKQELKTVLIDKVKDIKQDIDANVDILKEERDNVSITAGNAEEGVEDLEENPEETEYEEEEEIFTPHIETFLFLDDTTGIVEQLFLITLPRGVTHRFSVEWVGGVIIDVKAIRGN